MNYKITYNLDDIYIVPSHVTYIDSRSECNPRDGDPQDGARLPIFIAPMCTIINEYNIEYFNKDFYTIVPRTVEYHVRERLLKEGWWVAMGLKEAQSLYEEYLKSGEIPIVRIHVCIDQANGHMNTLVKLCNNLKGLLGDKIKIMIGNIANPSTLCAYGNSVDYVRIGIGSGNVCTTTTQTGIHYPMASLISECRRVIDQFEHKPKIIADGGFNNISQIIKALALGADYCMIGKIAASFEEACGTTVDGDGVYRLYHGMSTTDAQELIHRASKFHDSPCVLKHSEGRSTYVKVTTNIKDWVENFESALRSTMSYTNSKTLKSFIGKCEIVINQSHE